MRTGRERPAFPLLSPPKLVIFDCDGVLVDSEAIGDQVLIDLLALRGITVSLADFSSRYIGLTLQAVAEDLNTRYGLSLGDPWLEEVRVATETAFHAGLEPIPHVRELIEALERAGVPICVGSNGSVSKMITSLGITGLLKHFEDRLFSGQDMQRGKPFPDLFLHAADAMGAAPGDCVVIEDSAAGLKAAQAAGMNALAYVADPAHAPAELSGGHPFTDMRQVPGLIGLREAVR
ncbi:MAG: HAD-IA family hydrolase [Sphingomonadales bacterium]